MHLLYLKKGLFFMKKYIITIVTVTLVVLTVALGGFYYLTKDDNATTPK